MLRMRVDPAEGGAGGAVAQARRKEYQAFDRVQGLLTAALEELPDVPLYFSLHDIAHTCKTTPPRAEVMRSAIVNAGAGDMLHSPTPVLLHCSAMSRITFASSSATHKARPAPLRKWNANGKCRGTCKFPGCGLLQRRVRQCGP